MSRYDNLPLPKVTSAASLQDELRYEKTMFSVADFLQRVLSIIGGRTVPVCWTQPAQSGRTAIAFTDGETVWINPDRFRDTFLVKGGGASLTGTAREIAKIKGAAYHELAHILYTPRRAARPSKDLYELGQSGQYKESALRWSYNALEDQRIESMFVAKYAPARRYFTPMAIDFALKPRETGDPLMDEVNLGMAYTLLFGRRYMGSDVLAAAKRHHVEFLAKYGIKVRVTALEQIIDKYRALTFPADADTAITLVKRFYDYMMACYEPFGGFDPVTQSDPYGTPGGDHDMTRGSMKPAYEQRGTQEVVSELDEDGWDTDEESDEDFDDDTDGNGSSPSTDTDADADSDSDDGSGDGNDSDSDGDADGDGGKSDDPGNGDSDTDADTDTDGEGNGSAATNSNGGNGYGDKPSDDTPVKAKTLSDVLQQASEEQTAKIISMAHDDLKSIAAATQKSKPNLKPDLRGCVDAALIPGMATGSRKIQEAFHLIKSEGEELWERHSPNGKLNAGAAMSARGTHFDIFDQWMDIDEDALSFEVVILFDQSLSMQGELQYSASQAMWTLKSACDALDIPVTVIGYDTQARMLFRPEDKMPANTYKVLAARGNTNPQTALEWALSFMSASSASHKLLFSLTDGDWYSDRALKMVMAEAHRIGVQSTLVMLGAPVINYSTGTLSYRYQSVPHDKYCHNRLIKVGNVSREFPAAVKQAITEIARDVVSHHA